MATILAFRRKDQHARKPRTDGAPCEIVFYTGVRYERPGAPSPQTASRTLAPGDTKPTTRQA
jgi:hypothetical protein